MGFCLFPDVHYAMPDLKSKLFSDGVPEEIF